MVLTLRLNTVSNNRDPEREERDKTMRLVGRHQNMDVSPLNVFSSTILAGSFPDYYSSLLTQQGLPISF